jgi:hypothetical protein
VYLSPAAVLIWARVSAGFLTTTTGHESGWNSDTRRRSRMKCSVNPLIVASSASDAPSTAT